MNKSRHVTFRCTQEQYDQINIMAKEFEMTVSAYIVDSITDSLWDDAITLNPPQVREFFKDVDQIVDLKDKS